MKTPLLSAILALALAGAVSAADPAPRAVDPNVQELADQLRDLTQKMAELQKQVETVEARLGETYRPVSSFDTVERRLDDLEKDVDGLKRR